MGSGVGLKDHSSSFLGDNSSSLQPHLPEIQTRHRVKPLKVQLFTLLMCRRCTDHSRSRPQASAAHRGRYDALSADGEQPAPLHHLSGQLSRMRSCADLDPLAGRYILFTRVLLNIRLLRCSSGSMWFPKSGITEPDWGIKHVFSH